MQTRVRRSPLASSALAALLLFSSDLVGVDAKGLRRRGHGVDRRAMPAGRTDGAGTSAAPSTADFAAALEHRALQQIPLEPAKSFADLFNGVMENAVRPSFDQCDVNTGDHLWTGECWKDLNRTDGKSIQFKLILDATSPGNTLWSCVVTSVLPDGTTRQENEHELSGDPEEDQRFVVDLIHMLF